MGVGFLPLRKWKINRWLAYAIFFCILAWSRVDVVTNPMSDLYDNFVRDFALAVGCFVLFTALGQQQDAKLQGEMKGARLHEKLAGFSYTLYLAHVPLLIFTVAFMHDTFGIPFYQQPAIGGFVYGAFLFMLVYLYSYLFSRMTEAHTDKFRHWLRHRRQSLVAARAGR